MIKCRELNIDGAIGASSKLISSYVKLKVKLKAPPVVKCTHVTSEKLERDWVPYVWNCCGQCLVIVYMQYLLVDQFGRPQSANDVSRALCTRQCNFNKLGKI